jgi:hypothetical protein
MKEIEYVNGVNKTVLVKRKSYAAIWLYLENKDKTFSPVAVVTLSKKHWKKFATDLLAERMKGE